jgi:hypothetical protein
MKLAIDVYDLGPDELDRWDFVYGHHHSFAEMIEDSAAAWRYRIRPNFNTEEECRWAFLQLSCQMDKTQCTLNLQMSDFPSVARYISMRAELQVASLDASAGNGCGG